MHQNIEAIKQLYNAGFGIRLISQKVGVSKQTVRMRLIGAGVYLGRNHFSSSSPKQKDTDTIPGLELWETTGSATIEPIDGGWLVSLPPNSKIISPVVDNKNRAIEFSLDMRLIHASFSSIMIGCKNENLPSGSELNIIKSYTGNVSQRHMVKHLSNREKVQVFIKSGCTQETTILVSNLELNQCSGVGLTPINIVQTRKLEVGEKITLSWIADGAVKIVDYPDGKRQVTLPGFSSLYSRIPASAWEKKVKITFELDSFKCDLIIILGDNFGENKELIHINEKQFFTLSKQIGKKAYCRLDNRGFDTQTVFLIAAECEIIE